MFLRAGYLDVEFFPVQHGTWIDDSQSVIKMSTQELIDYIKSRVVSLSSDPTSGTVQKVQ